MRPQRRSRWIRSKGRFAAPYRACRACRCGCTTMPTSSGTTRPTGASSKTCSASRWSRPGARNRTTAKPAEIEFCHTFFGLADGSALAFFQFADPKMYEHTQAKVPAEIGRYDHIALKVDDPTYEALKARLNAAGEKFRETNHGYCKSIYTNSPDGLIVEFTCDPPDVAEIDALRRADAHSELQRWLGGDRRVNNELRHRDF